MRTLRAVYNYAKLKVDRALPQIDVTMLVEWNAEKRRNTGVFMVSPSAEIKRPPGAKAWSIRAYILEKTHYLVCTLRRLHKICSARWSYVTILLSE